MLQYFNLIRVEKAVVKLTKVVLKGFWKLDKDEKFKVLSSYANKLSEFYQIKAVFIREDFSIHGPHYVEKDFVINLPKPSVVSFLHEYGHHILQSFGEKQNELFPRGFSLSLFKKAFPKRFKRMRAEKKLLFVDGRVA